MEGIRGCDHKTLLPGLYLQGRNLGTDNRFRQASVWQAVKGLCVDTLNDRIVFFF